MPPTNFLREVKSNFKKAFSNTTSYDDNVINKIILVISDGHVDNHSVESLPLPVTRGALSKSSIYFVRV